ncbi:MAG: methyl-accepting chemotaxis protein [Caulobacteraceae bacterium]
MAKPEDDLRPERILELSERLSAVAGRRIGEIAAVNRMAKMLSINALIVAARAGDAGKGFVVVAEEFKKISTDIDAIAGSLESEVGADLDKLRAVGGGILEHLRGQRLIDRALNAIEIIDRNLYERTCDVRWWATDSAVVDCLQDPTQDKARHASKRLKVILDAYTVYLDLWICDPTGRVVATGRPDRYPRATGQSMAGSAWFQQAMRTKSGDEFVACDIQREPSLDDAPVATYATAIRAGGESGGEAIGVLGIHFDWRPQAQAVVDGVRLTEGERARSRVLILDQSHRVLAASDGEGVLTEVVTLDVSGGAMNSYTAQDLTVGYALTPGYETYRGLGWYGCVMQRQDADQADEAPAPDRRTARAA